MKFVFLTVLVVIASCIEAKSIPEVVQQRDLADFVANQLGLGAIWPQIQNLGGTLAQEIFMEGFQLIMAGGKQKLDAARQIFAKLVDDLTNHGIQSLQTATEMVKNAIKEVASLIKGSQKRDVADFLLNTIGLQGVWEEIQNLGATFVTQILNEAMQLVFAGQDKLKEAKEIFAQLAADLTSHTGNAATIVQNAINMVAEILKKPSTKRDVADFLLNTIGLQGVWEEIQNLGATFVTQILNEAMQLVFAGQDKLKEAKEIFAQLAADLTSHTGNAATIVQNAINMVAEILKKPTQQRAISDLIVSTLGLDAIWGQIQTLGNGFVSQIISEGMQLVFAGQEKLNAAKAVFAKLVDELTNHGIQTAQIAASMVKDAIREVANILSGSQKRAISDLIVSTLGLDAIWGQIQTLGNGFVSQIISEGMQLVFAGQEKLNAAKAVFAKLVDELTNHGIQTAQIAASMVKDAIREVANILSGSQKRDLADFIVNQLGLGAVWQEIQALGNGTVEQIVQEGLALLLSGKDVLEQAKEIFKQLVKDLLAHSQTTSSLVSTAIAAVAELLKKPQQL